MLTFGRETWIQQEPARDRDGNVCPVKDGVCWCLAGWMLRIGWTDWKSVWLEVKKRGYRSISQFNDDSEWSEIVEVMDICDIPRTLVVK